MKYGRVTKYLVQIKLVRAKIWFGWSKYFSVFLSETTSSDTVFLNGCQDYSNIAHEF